MQHILLKTTIPFDADGWHIGRFSLLADYLRGLTDEVGNPRFVVDTRDRCEDERGNDLDLVFIDRSDYQQLWLFGLEQENGLSFADLMGINVFHQCGRGLMLCRGPADAGVSLTLLDTLGSVWKQRPCRVSGKAGDAQRIRPLEPLHPLLSDHGSTIRQLPASPQEGAVAVPAAAKQVARVIATGARQGTSRAANIAVAFERYRDEWGELTGRALVESSWLRFSDYCLDPIRGCPVDIPGETGSGVMHDAAALADTQAYFRNIALWLAEQGLDDDHLQHQDKDRIGTV